MKVRFTKMQGAGNDFVVLDATRSPFTLTREQLRHLGDRRFGVGADQILVVEPGRAAGVDFAYRIFNGGGGEEVEQCGNGARCFVRFVLDKHLSAKTTLQVETLGGRLELRAHDDGGVTVDMGAPSGFAVETIEVDGKRLELATLSMGNPHAVQFVADVDAAPVELLGPRIERHPYFQNGVNAGFAQVVNRTSLRLRVWERGTGETLACGSGACAAVVAGISLGLLERRVEVAARGGVLDIDWNGGAVDHVLMTGPAETVYEGEIDL
ncbi:MAG: diaminopimelate epimerase [Caldimonas sp.]